MRYLKGKDILLTDTAVTLGKFDGFHLGHRELLDDVIKAEGLTSVVFTFDLNPHNLFSEREIKLIDTNDERSLLLSSTGLDYLIDYPFTKETADTEPEAFVRNVLAGQLGVKHIAVGRDFTFGKGGRGNVELLSKLSSKYGFTLKVYDKLCADGGVISSTRIRECIERGEMEEAARLLGRPYWITGEIIHGNAIGRTVGMPTIHQRPDDTKLLPPFGVYVSDTLIDGKLYRGITNIGLKPTVGTETRPGVETWLFDFDRDVYGEFAIVNILSFVRHEKKFNSVDEVKTQVMKDAEKARAWH